MSNDPKNDPKKAPTPPGQKPATPKPSVPAAGARPPAKPSTPAPARPSQPAPPPARPSASPVRPAAAGVGAKPAAPGAKPAVPGAKPVVPGAKPAAPGAKPAAGVRPAASGGKPAPSGKPAAGAQPSSRGGAAAAVMERPSEPAIGAGALDPAQVYYVVSDVDPTALIARHAGIDGGWLHWDDTNRERMRHALQVELLDGAVKVVTEDAVSYTFRPLTLELYDQNVRAKVELSPIFPTTEALVEFYRKTVF